MLTCIDVKFIFDSVRLDLSSSINILQIADVALRVVFLLFSLFLAIISPSSTCSSYSWNEGSVRHFSFHNYYPVRNRDFCETEDMIYFTCC